MSETAAPEDHSEMRWTAKAVLEDPLGKRNGGGRRRTDRESTDDRTTSLGDAVVVDAVDAVGRRN